jgi:hypothetical protein
VTYKPGECEYGYFLEAEDCEGLSYVWVNVVIRRINEKFHNQPICV